MEENENQQGKEMALKMKKVGILMNILMGVSLSFCLSLVGNLLSGHFAFLPWLISFAVSTVLSFLIGFLLPVRKCALGLSSALKLKERSFPSLLVESLVSDFFYTPLITLSMVFIAYKIATSHGAEIPFLPMFLSSLAVTFVIGFLLIALLQPLFLKLLIGKENIASEKN